MVVLFSQIKNDCASCGVNHWTLQTFKVAVAVCVTTKLARLDVDVPRTDGEEAVRIKA